MGERSSYIKEEEGLLVLTFLYSKKNTQGFQGQLLQINRFEGLFLIRIKPIQNH